MQCLILAGGLGTRIRSVAGETAKALLPAGLQTFIDWQLQWLYLFGVTEVILSLGHQGEVIQTHVNQKIAESRAQSKNIYPKVKYIFDGPKLLGTGGAIKHAASLLEDNFLVAYGDAFGFLNFKVIFDQHLMSLRTHLKQLTMSVIKNANMGDRSNIVVTTDAAGNTHAFYDKFNITPEMDHVDYGTLVLNKRYFLENTPDGAFDLAIFMTKACKENQATPYFTSEIFREIGSPEGYRFFCETLKDFDFDLRKLAAHFKLSPVLNT